MKEEETNLNRRAQQAGLWGAQGRDAGGLGAGRAGTAAAARPATRLQGLCLLSSAIASLNV